MYVITRSSVIFGNDSNAIITAISVAAGDRYCILNNSNLSILFVNTVITIITVPSILTHIT